MQRGQNKLKRLRDKRLLNLYKHRYKSELQKNHRSLSDVLTFFKRPTTNLLVLYIFGLAIAFIIAGAFLLRVSGDKKFLIFCAVGIYMFIALFCLLYFKSKTILKRLLLIFIALIASYYYLTYTDFGIHLATILSITGFMWLLWKIDD